MLVPGPDVIVGNLPSLEQFGDAGAQVGLAVGTESCNNGQVDVNWFALPSNDHPVIPQNLYRMSGGGDNTQRFEQVGQSWLKHAFTAASEDNCNFGCNDVFGTHLGSGCSDLYSRDSERSRLPCMGQSIYWLFPRRIEPWATESYRSCPRRRLAPYSCCGE